MSICGKPYRHHHGQFSEVVTDVTGQPLVIVTAGFEGSRSDAFMRNGLSVVCLFGTAAILLYIACLLYYCLFMSFAASPVDLEPFSREIQDQADIPLPPDLSAGDKAYRYVTVAERQRVDGFSHLMKSWKVTEGVFARQTEFFMLSAS